MKDEKQVITIYKVLDAQDKVIGVEINIPEGLANYKNAFVNAWQKGWEGVRIASFPRKTASVINQDLEWKKEVLFTFDVIDSFDEVTEY